MVPDLRPQPEIDVLDLTTENPNATIIAVLLIVALNGPFGTTWVDS